MKIPSIAIIDHVGLKAGMDCYDLDLFIALKNAGCSPVVYSNFESPYKEVFPVFKFRLKESIFSVLSLIRTYQRIASEVDTNGIDYCILHCFRFGFLEWLFMRRIVRSHARLFLIVHDPESLISKKVTRKWRDRMLKMADKIIVHNKFSYQQLAESISSTLQKKIKIIQHGNFISEAIRKKDVQKFRTENGFDAKKKYFLFFGQIKETKGLDLLLEAFAMTNNIVFLVIAGRMRRHSFDKYIQLIEKYNLEGRVKLFIRYITPETRDYLFQLADAVILPYRKVYQSGVMIMAMSYGKAVIVSDLPPNKEIIVDKQNGFLFSSDSAADLQRVLKEVIVDDKAREQVARTGFQFVKEKMDWNSIATEWIKLFQP